MNAYQLELHKLQQRRNAFYRLCARVFVAIVAAFAIAMIGACHV